MTPQPSPRRGVFRRLLPYLRPHWRRIALGLFLLLLAIPAGAFHPLVWAFIVDDVIGHRRVGLLLPAIGVMLAVQAIGTLLEAYRSNLLEKVGQRLVFDLRNEVYAKLQGQSLAYLHESRTGDLVARTMNDIDVLQEVAVQGTDSIIANVLSFAYVAGILIWLNWRLGLATLLPIGLVFLLTRRFNVRVKRLYREARDRLGAVGARLQENLTGMVVIKAFAGEAREEERFRAVTREYLATNFRAINARTTFFPTVRLVGFLSNVLSVGYGAWLVLQGTFTVGGLVAYRGYWWPLFMPINQLATINEMLQRAEAAGSRVFEVLDAEETVRDAPDAAPVEHIEGSVTFRGVSFSYGRRPVLRDVDFEVAPGEMVALVGPSGAGKTTVLNLIPRFYDPTQGRILVDGRDIAGLRQRDLRRHLAMVLQDTFLFNGTVLENIRYGNQDADMADVEAAVRAANATDFIAEMPRGFDTEIGERGVKLSGGQRQRLSIARAFLANPRILILDEPTSSVEPESEAIITQALERLMRGRTTFVTSHRFSLARGADRILVFDQGEIVEEGPHRALIAAGGLYAAMYRQQMGETVP
ncbi:MAG: ABC transporter ATP-binding protein [Chthonomonadales bacterium]|nr:ABC transporter ATP-binding protein [Chthonomonadales bacterium]